MDMEGDLTAGVRPTPPPLTLGLLAAAASVAVEAVYPLGGVGVYLLSVGAVSTLWGVRLGAAAAVVSVLLWDHFQTPHLGIFSFHIPDLLALGIFLGVALLAGSVAELARSRALEADARRHEADLAAELAHLLLRTQDLRSALPAAAQRLAQTLELPSAVIELDTLASDEQHTALPLHDGATQLGTLLVPADVAQPTQRRLRERIVPSLAAVLHAALERQAIGTALETSRDELRLLAEQQAALQRVATLVARGVCPTRLFRAVAGEMGQILEAEFIEIVRYETDGMYTVVGSWTRGKPTPSRPLGSRWPLEPGTVGPLLLRNGRPARIIFGRDGDGVIHRWVQEQGITSVVGCPIMVEGCQWGAMYAFSTRAEPQPAETEERMLEFTKLVATAIANTESRAQLIASRARVVATADETRRRIERDLHDGTQQRLLALALELRAAQAATPPELDQLRAHLAHTAQGLAEVTTELQEISRGIHPAILSSGGLAPALKTLARRSAVPVELTVNANQHLAEPVEVAAYYIVSEALTNAAKHAHASVVHVNLDVQDTILRLCVRDDGIGGANPDQGSGLTGLRDRVEALSGKIEISSPTGGGTSLTVTIPIHNDLLAAQQPAGARHLPHRGCQINGVTGSCGV
jgi:signal transduction histidine kinase